MYLLSRLTILCYEREYSNDNIMINCRVDRIRTLQVSFHQHLGKLEESQSSEQMWAHKSLKQEMHSLQKKLLVDNVSFSLLVK